MIAVCCMSDEYEAGGVRKMLSSVCEELRFVGAYSTDVPLGKDILFVHCHLWYAVCRPVQLSRGRRWGRTLSYGSIVSSLTERDRRSSAGLVILRVHRVNLCEFSSPYFFYA